MEENNLNYKTKIIAEIANSHQGDVDNAIDLANKSITSGVDAVKFQVYSADELLHKNHPRFKHFEKQSFNTDQWKKIFNNIKKKKAKIFCDIFGQKSFQIACNKKIDGLKIHSSDLINKNLLDLVSNKKNLEIFLSTGGSTINEISYAVSILKKNKIKPVLMHGFQNYPTAIEDTNLNRISYFKKIFKHSCKYGYQDHIAGDDEMNFIVPFVSISFGLDYIEKHVTLNRSEKGIDYYSSIEPKELKNFLIKIRKIKEIFGNNITTFSSSEKKYRKEVKKVWFAKKNIKKNTTIKKNFLSMKRPSNNKILPTFIEDFKNFKTSTLIDINEGIIRSKLRVGVTAIIVVRLNSKRLKNKAIKKINNESLIEHLIKRLKNSKNISNIILATTNKKEDLKLCKIAKLNKIHFYRGDQKNVLKRMLDASSLFRNDTIIRVTGDDILVDPYYLDKLIYYHLKNNLEYSNNKLLPGGTEAEIFNKRTLNLLLKIIPDPNQTEYLTYYITKNIDQFNTGSLPIKKTHRSKKSLSIDTLNDYLFVKKFLIEMKIEKKQYSYDMDDIIRFLMNNKKKKI